MKDTRRRLQQLQRRAAGRAVPGQQEVVDDDFAAWCRGGCVGPLPLAGSRPAKYTSAEQWQKHHRFLLALCCRSDPPGMTAEERRDVDEALAFFAVLDCGESP